MRRFLKRLTMTIVPAAGVLLLSLLTTPALTRLWATDVYPKWDDKVQFDKSHCSGGNACYVCSEGLQDYRCQFSQPAPGWGQGDCTHGYPGDMGKCQGTWFDCGNYVWCPSGVSYGACCKGNYCHSL